MALQYKVGKAEGGKAEVFNVGRNNLRWAGLLCGVVDDILKERYA